MFERIIAATTDLPVILQGALGSALFAFLVFAGQRAFAAIARQTAQRSKARKRQYLIEEQLKYHVLATKETAARGAFVSLLLYRAARHLFQALLWLTLGLIFGSIVSVLGIVGYLGCIYYLFIGIGTLTGPKKVGSAAERLNEIKAELERLGGA